MHRIADAYGGHMLKKKLIISPFNLVFWFTSLFFVGVLTVMTLTVKGRDIGFRKVFYIAVCLFNCVSFFLYKYELSRDREYDKERQFIGGFNWWGELPFHLCNINMTLMPLAVFFGFRPLMSFCFFMGPLGALMALLLPAPTFDEAYLFLPRIIGYYGTHYMIIVEAMALLTFGFYYPIYSDVPKAFLALIVISLLAHCLNTVIRRRGIYNHANYFYTMETEQIPALDMLYRFIPHPLFYELPLFPFSLIYMYLVVFFFGLIRK